MQLILEAQPENMVYEKLVRLDQLYKKVTKDECHGLLSKYVNDIHGEYQLTFLEGTDLPPSYAVDHKQFSNFVWSVDFDQTPSLITAPSLLRVCVAYGPALVMPWASGKAGSVSIETRLKNRTFGR